MVEISTGKPPYGSVPHDGKLALAICNGLRPRVAKGTPQCYIDLVNQCLDANPEKRPAAGKLWEIITNCRYEQMGCKYLLIQKELFHKNPLLKQQQILKQFTLVDL